MKTSRFWISLSSFNFFHMSLDLSFSIVLDFVKKMCKVKSFVNLLMKS